MPVRLLRRLTGTALWGAFRSPPARASLFAAKQEKAFPSSFPPSLLSLPQRAFTGGRVREARRPAPKANEAWTVFLPYRMKLLGKLVLTGLGTSSHHTVCHFAKKRVFSARFRRAALCCLPFSSARALTAGDEADPRPFPCPPLRPASGPVQALAGCGRNSLRMTRGCEAGTSRKRRIASSSLSSGTSVSRQGPLGRSLRIPNTGSG